MAEDRNANLLILQSSLDWGVVSAHLQARMVGKMSYRDISEAVTIISRLVKELSISELEHRRAPNNSKKKKIDKLVIQINDLIVAVDQQIMINTLKSGFA